MQRFFLLCIPTCAPVYSAFKYLYTKSMFRYDQVVVHRVSMTDQPAPLLFKLVCLFVLDHPLPTSETKSTVLKALLCVCVCV